MTELDLIRRHFGALAAEAEGLVLGIGDDCALLHCPPGEELAVSIDTLVSGVHFLPDCDPQALGHKSLAVGLSDLAAMGARPAWATLALTLPSELAAGDAPWVAAFARGFGALARAHRVALVGGDTTRGPLSITVQVHGFVPAGEALTRAGARPGDLVCVSGTLGDAALALQMLLAGEAPPADLRERLERPTPRVALGLALRGIASAMIDLSDGLGADLGHILDASGVGAELGLDALPLSDDVARAVDQTGDWSLPLSCGDDYELCFCVPGGMERRLAELGSAAGCAVAVIGRVTAAGGLVCRRSDGVRVAPESLGFDHFGQR